MSLLFTLFLLLSIFGFVTALCPQCLWSYDLTVLYKYAYYYYITIILSSLHHLVFAFTICMTMKWPFVFRYGTKILLTYLLTYLLLTSSLAHPILLSLPDIVRISLFTAKEIAFVQQRKRHMCTYTVSRWEKIQLHWQYIPPINGIKVTILSIIIG